jgi:poly-gamma-glutamate synthesis protein (capsule biosynthesis protein)
VSNFPLSYQLTWLPRFLNPSTSGERGEPAGVVHTESVSPVVRIAFVGDISAVANKSAPAIDRSIRQKLEAADLVIGNCESPVVERVRAPFATGIGRKHAMTTRFLLDLLDAASVSPERLVLSLANNHALDQGVEGLDETRDSLHRAGIRTVGAFEDGLVPTVRAGPLTIALAAFTQWRNGPAADFRDRVIMTDDMLGDGFAAMRGGGADLVCALPHWDLEFRHFPRDRTRALARKLVENGVRLIVGHHAHVLQPVEAIGDALVAFGLGDFVGTAWPRVRWPLRIGSVLFVDIGTASSERGSVLGHEVLPFFRARARQGERLVPLSALGPMRARVEKRLATVHGVPVG